MIDLFVIKRIIRSKIYRILGKPRFRSIGVFCKLIGTRFISIGNNVSIGDFVWIEAVSRYKNWTYNPKIYIGDNVSLSDMVHISAAKEVIIESGCLLGSNIYIGDHSHGDIGNPEQAKLPPSERPLAKISPITIGKNSWICDGSVILAGSKIPPNSIVAANSVVKIREFRPCIIAGNPAKVIKYIAYE